MDWLTSLHDQLPLLLVLSPLVGFLITLTSLSGEHALLRHLAVSNSLCTLLILGGVVWAFENEPSDADIAKTLMIQDPSLTEGNVYTLESVHRTMDRQRAEHLSRQWFVIDGTNLWPTFVLAVMTNLVLWGARTQVTESSWFFPNVLLFQAASLAALMAYDLQTFLLSFESSVLVMTWILGQWGGRDRRIIAGRFLFSQFCGTLFVMLGFAMLIVAVPWMKIEDSPKLPAISWHISTIVYEVQKWTSGNELAFQYENEVFPWMLLILSLGFAIQFGMFPFHSCQVAVLSQTSPVIVMLYVTGILSACSIGWLRFVVPLAPDLLAAFDWLILVPSLGAAFYGSICALFADQPRKRAAYLFLSFSGISLLGCFSFTRVTMCAGWLMQQQLALSLSATLMAFSSSSSLKKEGPFSSGASTFELLKGSMASVPASMSESGRLNQIECEPSQTFDGKPSTRMLLLMLCIPAIGFFASGLMILSELIRESLLLAACALSVAALNLLTVYFSLIDYISSESQSLSTTSERVRSQSTSINWSLYVVLSLAVVANIFPNLMLRQCEPEFARVLRRFEPSTSADSAEPVSDKRQKSP